MKPWYPGGDATYASSPDYFTIPVFDDFVRTIPALRPGKRDAWREARRKALEGWSQSGLRFYVVEGTYRWLWPEDGANHDLEMFGQFERGSIVLRRQKIEDPGTVGIGQWVDNYGDVTVDIGLCTFDYAVVEGLSGMREWVSGVIAHEVGHVLGFGHNGTRADPPGDSNVGVMALGYGGGDFSPSDEEIEAVKAYYKLR